MALVTALPDKATRARLLETLAPHLSPTLLNESMASMQTIRDDLERSLALTAVLPHLKNDATLSRILDAALRTARAVSLSADRATALAALAPELARPQAVEALAEAIEAVRATPERERTRPLLTVATSLVHASDETMTDACVGPSAFPKVLPDGRLRRRAERCLPR